MGHVAVFLVISIITGFLLTYFLSARYSIFERLAYGITLGLGLQTWTVYLFSLPWGLRFRSIYLSIALTSLFCLIFVFIKRTFLKENILCDIKEIKDDFLLHKTSYFAHIAVFSFFTTIFCRLFYRTIIWKDSGIYVGLSNNYGDLPLHLAYITSFAWGDNLPPQNPAYAGEKLIYPILSDFLSAIFLKSGLSFRDILFVPGLILTISFYGILYYFTYRLTKKRLAAILSLFIFFFAGGFGFYYFFQDLTGSSDTLWEFLTHLPRNYTKIVSLNYQWITPLTCLNVPQRSFLFGFPVTIFIFSLLYTGIDRKEWKEFLFAGVLAGTLPFFHTHSFLALLMVTIPLGIIFWDWRRWFLFFFPAFVLSLPQVLYFSNNVGDGGFFKIHFGWVSGEDNFFWFWLKNTGVFWFFVTGGFIIVFLRKKHPSYSRLGLFSLPFLILFLVPNIVLFAPWTWDNIKMLIYWFLGATPLAALSLTYLYENRRLKILSRAIFFLSLFSLIAAGGIDLFKYAIAPIHGWKEFNTEEIEIAKFITEETPADAVFLNAPVHDHLVFLSGRKSLMGFSGHIWSHGYSGWRQRERDIKRMLKGGYDAVPLIEKYKPHYIIIGPHEKRLYADRKFFDNNYSCILTTKRYNLYDLTKKKSEKIIMNKFFRKHGLYVRYYDNINWTGKPVYEEVDANIQFNWPHEDEKRIPSPFSAIWQGTIVIEKSNQYTFRLSSDDGSWLYIDDKLVIDNGGAHSVKSKNGTLFLEKGKHQIRIKYFDNGGGAVLNLLWKSSNGVETNIPEKTLFPGYTKNYLIKQKYGLYVRYYDNIEWQGSPLYKQVDTDIEFNWADEHTKFVPSPFSAIWTGFLVIETPGEYGFILTSDDGSWLYINDTVVINNGGNHSVRAKTGTVSLGEGMHKIRIKYFDKGGGAVIRLLWKPPGGKVSKIPEEKLMFNRYIKEM